MMAILKYFVYCLELLEQIAECVELLSSPLGLAAMVCLTSYEILLLLGCGSTNALVLAFGISLTFHSTANRPHV